MAGQYESELRTISFDGTEIIYLLKRKDVKNLNLRIRPDGSVHVSANPAVSADRVDEFVSSKSDYVLSAVKKFSDMERYRPQPKTYVSGETFNILGRGLRLAVTQGKRNEVTSDGVYLRLSVKNPDDYQMREHIVKRYLDKQCREVFREILETCYPVFRKYSVPMPSFRIRDMETRWGSCSSKRGVITLNKRLLVAPRHCIEYVVTHELCHLVHPNHSKRFYEFLTMLMPDWRERKKTLDLYAQFWL